MARRRSGKYTVGLPRPGPNPEEIVRRFAWVVQTYGNYMMYNYYRGIVAVASNPQALAVMARKLAEWYAAFFGANVPQRYAEIMMPVRAQYKARIRGLITPPAPAAAAPTPPAGAPAPVAAPRVAPPPAIPA